MLSQKKESYISYFKINAKQSNLGVYRPQIGSQNFIVSNKFYSKVSPYLEMSAESCV